MPYLKIVDAQHKALKHVPHIWRKGIRWEGQRRGFAESREKTFASWNTEQAEPVF